MNDPLKALLDAGVLSSSPYPANSRYYGVAVTTTTTASAATAEGEPVAYLRRRFVPAPERFAVVQEHLVRERDRPDTVAAQYLGDPELYFRLCDANGVLAPKELTETIGTRIRITLPEGVPSATGGDGA
jgi:hypothetical protein